MLWPYCVDTTCFDPVCSAIDNMHSQEELFEGQGFSLQGNGQGLLDKD